MRFALFALALLAAACGAPAVDEATDEATGATAAEPAAPVVIDVSLSDLDVERLSFDLDQHIARFLAPPDRLPLDRVELTDDGQPGELLADVMYDCFGDLEYDESLGDAFVVTASDDGMIERNGQDCLPCGLALICPGLHHELGEGAPPSAMVDEGGVATQTGSTGDSTSGDDGADDGRGTDDGSSDGSSGGSSGGSSNGSSSGSSDSGSGGNHGGVGNPGWG